MLAAASAVVRLDGDGGPRQLDRVGVRQAHDVSVGSRHIGPLGQPIRTQNELPRLGPHAALEDGARPPSQRRLEQPERVGIDLTTDDGLAEAVAGLDEDDSVEAAVGVEREHHAGDADVRAHHVLDRDRQADGEVVESVIDTIGDRPVGEEGREAPPARAHERVGAVHAEERLLLTGEARLGQVLGRRAGAHRDRDVVSVGATQRGVRLPNGSLELDGPDGSFDERTDRRARLGQRGDVAAVDAVQEPGDAVTNTVGVQDRGVGIGGDREAVGHAQSRPRQFAMQLAQRGRLAADQRHVIQRDVAEPSDVAQGRGGHRASASSAT